ncbi:MAG: hypothetical protein KGI40_06475 [Xanthomonadaceae bacterium]|nr:hypothetical protein [Xanthomonadaceae bacterium]MDE1958713.1 hypothetical protein [Xanthomonadaceae bacterium]MDE2177253.1 hypothetical protein [Xanthomonadaceae bacterium]MDE2245697.1 hypothetical protein [Xanthomonadaceae bacterium]
MIVTDRFVFLHLHKSGGTFVNRFLQAFFPDARQIGYHLPRTCLPASCAALPLLGSVRNPWDYYVSWYAFQTAKPRPNPVFRVVSDQGRLGFADSVRNLLTLGEQPALLDAVRSGLPDIFPNRGINLTRDCLEPLVGSRLGFYSFLYQHIYGEANDVSILDMHALRDGLPVLLEQIGVPATAAMRHYLSRAPALNSSEHGHYADYYDATLRALVAERDAEVIARHSYAFEVAGS